MKLVRFIMDGEMKAGLVEDDTVFELATDIFGPYEKTGRSIALDQACLKAPTRPGKVVAIGLNYRDHAREVGLELPTEPMMFMKPSTSVIGPGDAIEMPPISKRVDYEAELGVVIGRRARNIDRNEAADYILGYTCLNDVTARDLQNKDGQWIRAKGFDTFCPIGPYIITDLDPSDLSVTAWLNGDKKQDSRTSNLVFSVYELVEHITQVMTLEPGDVIATGTPSGISAMADGDSIEIRIQGIGSLVNPVKAV